jgi:hypothetical protein
MSDPVIKLSTIPPLPFWPNLKWTLRSHGAALLLIYLEVHFPAPQDAPDASVLVDVDRTRLDLRLTSDALYQAMRRIAARWPTLRTLRVARQVGREFFTRHTLGAGALKPYSYMPVSKLQWQLRRNTPRLKSLMRECDMPYPLPLQGVYDKRNVAIEAHHVQNTHSQPLSGALLASEYARSIAGLSDGRRQPGLRRREHSRAPWTAERRAKFMATMVRRYGWVPKNTAKHLSDSQIEGEVSDREIDDLSSD